MEGGEGPEMEMEDESRTQSARVYDRKLIRRDVIAILYRGNRRLTYLPVVGEDAVAEGAPRPHAKLSPTSRPTCR
jgi:hypothetical protein